MARRYDSFLVRRWERDGSDPRIEVEHIQSGRRAQMASIALAVAWMDASNVEDAAIHPGHGGSGEDPSGGDGNA